MVSRANGFLGSCWGKNQKRSSSTKMAPCTSYDPNSRPIRTEANCPHDVKVARCHWSMARPIDTVIDGFCYLRTMHTYGNCIKWTRYIQCHMHRRAIMRASDPGWAAKLVERPKPAGVTSKLGGVYCKTVIV